MTLAEVSAGWNKVGLRKSDLRDAIREMVEHRCLISYNYLDSLAFELTEHGAMRFDVCRDYKPGLQDWLKEQRAARGEDPAVDALSSTWNRRALQTLQEIVLAKPSKNGRLGAFIETPVQS